MCRRPTVLCPATSRSPNACDLPGDPASPARFSLPLWLDVDPPRGLLSVRVSVDVLVQKLRLHCRPTPVTASSARVTGPGLLTRRLGACSAHLRLRRGAAGLPAPVACGAHRRTEQRLVCVNVTGRRAPWCCFDFNFFHFSVGSLTYLRVRLAFVIPISRSVFSCILLILLARGHAFSSSVCRSLPCAEKLV